MAGWKAKQTQIPQPHLVQSKPGLGGLQQVEPAHDQQRKSPESVHLQTHPIDQRIPSNPLISQAAQLRGHNDLEELLPQRHP